MLKILRQKPPAVTANWIDAQQMQRQAYVLWPWPIKQLRATERGLSACFATRSFWAYGLQATHFTHSFDNNLWTFRRYERERDYLQCVYCWLICLLLITYLVIIWTSFEICCYSTKIENHRADHVLAYDHLASQSLIAQGWYQVQGEDCLLWRRIAVQTMKMMP